jgi:hypothetical protein
VVAAKWVRFHRVAAIPASFRAVEVPGSDVVFVSWPDLRARLLDLARSHESR